MVLDRNAPSAKVINILAQTTLFVRFAIQARSPVRTRKFASSALSESIQRMVLDRNAPSAKVINILAQTTLFVRFAKQARSPVRTRKFASSALPESFRKRMDRNAPSA